ncbi:MAG: MoxR family ATPase [Gammaproteobacteria bacterium]|nr:MoxR family ATPase [Gammaproteobacteria bacterium]
MTGNGADNPRRPGGTPVPVAAEFAVDSPDVLAERLRDAGYLVPRALATSTFLALRMGKPLLLEGDPGVGKTELALALSRAFDAELVRLQCYEGLDMAQAAYEWNYPRQLLQIRLAEAREGGEGAGIQDLFTEDFLLPRPLMHALDASEHGPVVLLIDELDRADEPFEAFLLEFLSDFQLSIPELGTRRAARRPPVIITSNRTREIHDAIRRRCLYSLVAYPSPERELAIILAHLPDIDRRLAAEVAAFVAELRAMQLFKRPGVAETVDWCTALYHMNRISLDPDTVQETVGTLLKYEDDIERADPETVAQLIGQARNKVASGL